MIHPKIVKAKIVIEVEAEVMLDLDGNVEEVRDIRDITDVIELNKILDVISNY